MSTKIGHFEILSELAKSPTGTVYKANDPESGQTIALKAIQLSAFGDSAAALEQALLAEAESTKVLSSPNITTVYGAGEIDGQFCAAMEYVQGNSIATMLARKEGFSIWDLLDIGRQLVHRPRSCRDRTASFTTASSPPRSCAAGTARSRFSGYGVSSVGNVRPAHVPEGVPSILHYMSPEQVRGEATDGRSNLFSLGAMFYEMVTERKAFDRDDVESLRQSIVESTPVPPIQVNPKVHPLLSDLIMKALAKDPAERYQNGRELLDDLEKCKESKTLAAKKPEAPKERWLRPRRNAAAQSKFIASAREAGSGCTRSKATCCPAPARSRGEARLGEAQQISAAVAKAGGSVCAGASRSKLAAPKAAAAAAGWAARYLCGSSLKLMRRDRSVRSVSSRPA